MSSPEDDAADTPAEGLPAETAATTGDVTSEMDQPPPASLSDQPTADEEVTGDQVEATVEAAEAEGHADMTAAGVGDEGVDPEPEGPPVAEAVVAAEAGLEPDTAPEQPEPEPADPTSPDSSDELRLGLLEVLKAELGDGVVGAHIIDGDDLWVRFTPEAWREAGQIAKGKLGCTYFCFLSTIDWLPSPWGRSEDSPLDVPRDPATIADATPGYAGGWSRFQVFARVQDPTRGLGFTLKVDVPMSMELPTWIPVYAGADWHEREAWEMYGVRFVGHPNLVHLYLPTEFEGHPGRKDFPLLARQVKPWPGIVDVEPMPDEADDSGEDGAEAPAAEASRA